jgi:hypothetical protein
VVEVNPSSDSTVQGCAEALETLVRDAGGPEGLARGEDVRIFTARVNPKRGQVNAMRRSLLLLLTMRTPVLASRQSGVRRSFRFRAQICRTNIDETHETSVDLCPYAPETSSAGFWLVTRAE